MQKEYDRNIKILCENGKITWNWHDNKLLVKENKKDFIEYPAPDEFEVNQMYVDEIKDFISLVQTSQPQHPLDLDHAISNTELMLLMHQSSLEGKKINVNN